jgi:hypothetical protein
MKRIAFFVEGLTEQLFLQKLIQEVFTENQIAIESTKIQGGSKVRISFTTISASAITDQTKYYILIYDCGGEKNIRSYINEQRESLIKNNYSKIIGIRDVYPDFLRTDIHKLIKGLNYGLSQTTIRTEFILAIMEIEAWFLAESTHFSKIDPALTVELIKTKLSFDPSVDDMESRNAPANDLHNCYQLVKKKYVKEEAYIKRTIDALDYAELYFNLPDKVTSLKQLVVELDNFIS